MDDSPVRGTPSLPYRAPLLLGVPLLAGGLGLLAAQRGITALVAVLALPLGWLLLVRPYWALWLLIGAVPVTVDFGAGVTVTRVVLPLVALSVMCGAVTRRCAWPSPVGSAPARAASALILIMLVTAAIARAGSDAVDWEFMLTQFNGYATRFAIFFIALSLVKDERDLQHALRALVVSATIEALIVFAQIHFRLVLPGEWRFGAITDIENTAGVFRAEGTTPHPIYLAGYLQMVLPFALLLMVRDRGWWRVLSAIGFVLMLYAWANAYSRSSLLGIATMVALAACIWSRSGRYVVLALVVAGIFGLSAHGWSLTEFARTLEQLRHFGQLVRSDQLTPLAGSLQFRLESSAGGFNLFLAHPWVGIGLGQAKYHYAALLPAWATSPFHPNVIHNAFLEIAAETGFAGLLGYGCRRRQPSGSTFV